MNNMGEIDSELQSKLETWDASKWYLGDLANIATYHYGGDCTKWEEATGCVNLKDYAKVATRFPISLRQKIYETTNGNLRWEHFKTVVSLDNEYASYFLRKADEKGWSVKRLGDEIKKHKARK